MTLLRSLAIISASLLLLNSCGGKKEEAPKEPVKTTTEASAEDLFDEFYDSSDVVSEEPAEDVVQDIEKDVVEEISEAPAPAFAPDGRYVVQVSCVANEAIAEDVARKLEKSGYPVYVAEVENPTPMLLGTYYRIRIGGFNNLTDAKNFGEYHLLPAGYDYWLDNRSNDNVGIGDFGLGAETSLDSDPYTAEDAQADAAVSSYGNDFVEEAVSAGNSVIDTVKETAGDVVDEVKTTTSDDEWGTSDW